MKIREVRFFKALSPLSRPIADSTHAIPEIGFLVTRLTTDTGVVGEAYLLAFHYSPNAIRGALRDAAAMAEGWDPADVQGLVQEWERASEYFGNPGLNRWALGSIEIAMWDVLARAQGVPVWKLLGGNPAPVPLYGSGGWLSYSVEELIDEARGYVGRGFRAVKVKVGSSLENDLERLRRVREAVGPHVELLMDANQGLDLDGAIQLAKRARGLDIGWFEEPLEHTDFDGYAALNGETDIPLAMGEREFDLTALRELSGPRKALDLWQPDILRLGGVTGWMASASLAQERGLPVLPHFYKEYDVPLLSTVANVRGAESFDWVDPLIDSPIRMEGGFARAHEGPGWGFRFLDEHLVEAG
ncbi:MAG: mandelate racemase/muconate lactonizing enzyme family protein [Fimbriimonadaceae bacterium]|nr:mandelate racemase/muconate lactonizing enzyme family protein [Fimbriimonadaceae bacterium]